MKTMFSIAALLAASLATPVLALDASGPRNFTVPYADLDLSKETGIRTLDQRIHNAVATACGIPSSADPQGRAKVKACRAEAKARAETQRSRAIALAREANATELATR